MGRNYQSLKTRLTNDELREKGQEIAEKIREHAELKAALESINADYKARMKSLALQIDLISRTVNDKYEYRDVEVEEWKDYQRAAVDTIRRDTWETVGTRPMTETERQQEAPVSSVDPIAESSDTGFAPDASPDLAVVDASAELAETDEAAGDVGEVDFPAPDRNTLEGGLLAALHSFEGADQRWKALRDEGATDRELKRAISDEFGLGGSRSSPESSEIAYKGGADPAFWFDSRTAQGKPTLRGKALIDKARKVLRIPLPGAAASPHNGHAEVDLLDLVPFDPHNRTWSSLPDSELLNWKIKLESDHKAVGVLGKERRGEAPSLLGRVDAECRRRDQTWDQVKTASGD